MRPSLLAIGIALLGVSPPAALSQTVAATFAREPLPVAMQFPGVLHPLAFIQAREALNDAASFRTAAVFASTDPEAFAAAVDRWERQPAVAQRLAEAGSAADIAVAHAVAASNQERFEKLLATALTPDAKQVVRADSAVLSHSLRSAKQANAKPWGAFFANGDVRGVALGESKSTSVASGSLGVRVRTAAGMFLAQVSLAASADTVISGHGRTALAPAAGGRSAALLDARFSASNGKALSLSNWHLYGAVGSRDWRGTVTRVDPETSQAVEDVGTANANILGAGALIFVPIAPEGATLLGSPIVARAEIGFAIRYVGGEIGSNDLLRTAILGVDSQWFPGIQAGLEVAYGQLGAAIGLYHFRGKAQGIGGFGLSAAFSAVADIVSGPLSF